VAWTERGKASQGKYQARVQTVDLSLPLSQWARKVAREGRWTRRLKRPRDHVKAIVGQIASGEKVIADDKYRTWLQGTFSDAVAMESGGFGRGGAAGFRGEGGGCVIRGFSDAGEGSRWDRGHPDAAYAAAAFAFELFNVYSSVPATAVSVSSTVSHERQGE